MLLRLFRLCLISLAGFGLGYADPMSPISEHSNLLTVNGAIHPALEEFFSPHESKNKRLRGEKNSSASQKKICGISARRQRVSARYTSAKGIGYNQGYTTLEGFFSPCNLFDDEWLPFLDLRGHIFDNGKMAANAGVGFRYLSSKRVWGVNSYYDYRNTSRQHYNQISVGFETLGRVWDFRMNGYLPVGKKQSSLFHTNYETFRGNYLLLRSAYDFALKGVNAEAGFHLDHFKKAPLYFAAGPYYLTGKGASTWGGKLRASVELFNHRIRLEANTGFDHFFKWTGQGRISVNIPFGGKGKVKKTEDNSCSQAMTLATRIIQPVDRSEIIPVGKQHLLTPAINPETGEPYFFLFVNNTSHSQGTYESPFPTLTEAETASSPGNILYVFPGDGSAYDASNGGLLSSGLALQDFQMLLGASIAQSFPTTLGNITVPPLASTTPVITTTVSSGNVVTLGNGNTISGFYIAGQNEGAVFGNNINNFIAAQNTIVGNGASSGILLHGVSGQIGIRDSALTANTSGLYISNTSSIDTLDISGSTFVNTTGIYLDIDSSVANLSVSSSHFMNGSNGIDVNGSVSGALTVSGSTFSRNDRGLFQEASSSIGTLSISESTFLNSQTFGVLILGSLTTLTITDTAVSASSNSGIYVGGPISGILTVSGSSFVGNGHKGIILSPSISINEVRISESDFSGNLENGLFIASSSNVLTITDIVISASGSNGLLLHYGAVIGAANIHNSTFTGNNDGIDINSVITDSIAISNCTSSNNRNHGINVDTASSILSLILSNNSVNSNTVNGIFINTSNPLQSVNISESTFNENFSNGLELASGCSVSSLNILDSSFINNLSNGIELDGGSTTEALNISGSTFCNNISNHISLDSSSTVPVVNIAHSSFYYSPTGILADLTNTTSGSFTNNVFTLNTEGLSILNVGDTALLTVSDNTFTGIYSSSAGYASSIALTGTGTICLDFAHNSATPISGASDAAAYFWNNTGAGVFNVTSESTQANNIGLIQQMNISPPGSCL